MNDLDKGPVVDWPAPPRGCGPKERLFHAAICVALENGFGKVTLDAVAQQAGISKGGLLHHFATKKHLIRAMLEHYADAPRDRHLTGIDTDPLAVAALVAAAEDTLLLETISPTFDLQGPGRTCGEQRAARLALASSFANRLCLKTSRAPISTDA
ncbi:TetR/AcrR family transcriptional regulator [Aminobacter sp. AP02]|uniref:TetR/AcrR family transcriptional regulator n=1 Tax=Aminobacter sp. AP02 TaxID=2135737 RepID=UPI000D6D0D78|nr:TetR/AcrR family transcriptional regulator [Aminobacter sp. AP02]PWK74034.1 TetR family transcriptional regulator [Aminobacter sp. AP02]